jgi:DNA-binding NarL/FixJ family response regulator
MNVCLVEDSLPIQQRLQRLIEQIPETGVTAIAGDIRSAEQMVLQPDGTQPPDKQIQAVILDLIFPEGNSLELLKKIKLQKPQIKVVIFSNHASDEWRLLAMRAGADSFLDKSTDSEMLVQVLQNWQHTISNPST